MNGLNFQASVSNLTQMDRYHQETHRTPVVNQEQNAQIAQDEAARRTMMPMQPDEAEGKKIDHRQRKGDDTGKKKSRKKTLKNGSAITIKKSGNFLDIRI